MLTLRMGWSGLPQIGVSAKEAIRKATVPKPRQPVARLIGFSEIASSQSLMSPPGAVGLRQIAPFLKEDARKA
ncbi:MAG: hypothetical protein ACI4N8_03755 [Megasphaera sp.]|uniref:hypothetical protein n=1 Tax=Megasphaera sp. TaxID=2023260 RepID=UPI003EFE6BF7